MCVHPDRPDETTTDMSTKANDIVDAQILEWRTTQHCGASEAPTHSAVRLELRLGERTIAIELRMQAPTEAALEHAGALALGRDDGPNSPAYVLAATLLHDHNLLAAYAISQAFWLLDLDRETRTQLRDRCNVPLSLRTLAMRALHKVPAAIADEIADLDEAEWDREIGNFIDALVTLEFNGKAAAATRRQCDGCGYMYSLVMGEAHHQKRCYL